MIKEILPETGELPLSYAQRLSRVAASLKSPAEKQKYGQYFTSIDTARFMASFSEFSATGNAIRILDPGTGTAVLSCALIEYLLSKSKNLSIDLVCYEADPFIIPFAKPVLEYLKQYVNSFGARFEYKLYQEDFLAANKDLFFVENKIENSFDIIISNPPFFKLPPGDERKEIAESVFGGQPNIYSLFLYAAVKLLSCGGELVFLIPRSFCSGSFFGQFRKRIYDKLMFQKVHLFSSSEEIFDECGTLENSIILKGALLQSIPENYKITISRNKLGGLTENKIFNFNFSKSKNIIPLPASKEDELIFDEYNKCSSCLKTLGYSVNGGKALKADMKKYAADSSVDVSNKALVINKDATGSAEYINICNETGQFLIPNGNYIFLRRYNKTEREKKISAFAYINNLHQIKYLCIDKQLLYINPVSGSFAAQTVLQLTEALNCEKLNRYLYIVYGNINLSPEEVEDIPFPWF